MTEQTDKELLEQADTDHIKRMAWLMLSKTPTARLLHVNLLDPNWERDFDAETSELEKAKP